MQVDRPPGGDTSKPKAVAKATAIKKRPQYIKLKKPDDVMAYVQQIVNRLRDSNQEIEQLGKITNLLNVWIAAHKDKMETDDYKKLRAEMDEFKAKMEAR